MLTDRQRELYNAFSESTHQNEYLESKTAAIVGLAVALAINYSTCAEHYLQLAKKENVSKEEIAEITAKVMAVSAGQKRVQARKAMDTYKVKTVLSFMLQSSSGPA